MAKYKYTGSGKRVFPTLGITVKSGDTFDAPDNLILKDVELVSGSAPKEKAPEPIITSPEPTPSDSDKNVGE